MYSYMFFFNDTATTEIYTLSLHDALPILKELSVSLSRIKESAAQSLKVIDTLAKDMDKENIKLEGLRSEEHTSELQSRQYLVCRLLLEKKKLSTICALTQHFHFYEYSPYT